MKKQVDTSKKILDAALQVFSDVGFNGARVDEIARIAGVNKATIYYHLGDKQALYEKVLHELFSDMVDRVVKDVQAADTATDKLIAYIRRFAALPERYPHLPPVMLREIAGGGQNLPPVVIRQMARIIETLSAIMNQGVREDHFNRIPVVVIQFMLVGAIMFFSRMRPVLKENAELAQGVDPAFDIPENIVDSIQTVLLTALTSGRERISSPEMEDL